ncbi:MAG TPA: hypothetical protein VFG56_02845 [Candidatus Saccharimonadales bacterium]|nr:hypothetical protein [Candidatus Saccharimonadales bacterium]
MITLNLLPDVKKEFLKAQRAKATWTSVSILVTIAAIGLTVLVAGWVYGAQNVHKSVLTNSIKENEQKLKDKKIDKYLTIQNQLATISDLHNQKNDFSRLFGFLPNLNPAVPDSIGLSSLTIDTEDETIDFQGDAPNYEALTTFKDTLLNAKVTYREPGSDKPIEAVPLFSNVVVINSALIDNSKGSGTVVSFEIKVNYETAAFVYANKDVQVEVPNKDTTNSTINAPVFSGEQAKPDEGTE